MQIMSFSCKIHAMSMYCVVSLCLWTVNVHAFDPLTMAYVHGVKAWIHARENRMKYRIKAFVHTQFMHVHVHAHEHVWTGHELCIKLLWLWAWKAWNIGQNSQTSWVLLGKINTVWNDNTCSILVVISILCFNNIFRPFWWKLVYNNGFMDL